LSLANDAGKFFDRVDIPLGRRPLDQVLVVALAPTAQPSEHDRLLSANP
jgi:hypothetical protein